MESSDRKQSESDHSINVKPLSIQIDTKSQDQLISHQQQPQSPLIKPSGSNNNNSPSGSLFNVFRKKTTGTTSTNIQNSASTRNSLEDPSVQIQPQHSPKGSTFSQRSTTQDDNTALSKQFITVNTPVDTFATLSIGDIQDKKQKQIRRALFNCSNLAFEVVADMIQFPCSCRELIQTISNWNSDLITQSIACSILKSLIGQRFLSVSPAVEGQLLNWADDASIANNSEKCILFGSHSTASENTSVTGHSRNSSSNNRKSHRPLSILKIGTVKDSSESSILAATAAITTSSYKISSKPTQQQEEKYNHPTGVFTPLTPCYSATCYLNSNESCYSLSCPNKLSQVKTTKALSLAAKSRIAARSGSLANVTPEKFVMPNTWSEYVPVTVLSQVHEDERRRQEVLYEIIKTEHEYLHDLRVLDGVYAGPLARSNIIDAALREEFIQNVFGNLHDVIKASSPLCAALVSLLKEHPVVPCVGDIFIDWLTNTNSGQVRDAYVRYGEFQPLSKYYADEEQTSNNLFLKFCEANERRPECRKLPLNSFLSRPTTRLARYPLLLQTLLKKTPAENTQEIANLQECITKIKDLLSIVNEKSGRMQCQVRLKQVRNCLVYKDEEQGLHCEEVIDFDHPNRRFLREGTLLHKTHSSVEPEEVSLFLFDNGLLITAKRVDTDGTVSFVLKRWAIPIYLVAIEDETIANGISAGLPTSRALSDTAKLKRSNSSASSLRPPTSTTSASPMSPSAPSPGSTSKQTSDLLLRVGGRFPFKYNLSSSYASVNQWAIDIRSARDNFDGLMNLYVLRSVITAEGSDVHVNKVPPFLKDNTIYCSDVIDGYLLIGCQNGLYAGMFEEPDSFTNIYPTQKEITRISVSNEWRVVLFVADSDLILVRFTEIWPAIGAKRLVKRTSKIASNISFFEMGLCMDKWHLFVVKSKVATTTIKMYVSQEDKAITASDSAQPSSESPVVQGRKRMLVAALKNLSITNDNPLDLVREIYIPGDCKCLFVLKSKICVGTVNGFELVDTQVMKTQELLDSTDDSLSSLNQNEANASSPLAMFKLTNEIDNSNEYLLCFQKYGVYVTSSGRNSRPNAKRFPHITWISIPHSFAQEGQDLIAFDSALIEIRGLQSGELKQVIKVDNVHLASSIKSPVYVAMRFLYTQQQGSLNSIAPTASPFSAKTRRLKRTSTGSSSMSPKKLSSPLSQVPHSPTSEESTPDMDLNNGEEEHGRELHQKLVTSAFSDLCLLMRRDILEKVETIDYADSMTATISSQRGENITGGHTLASNPKTSTLKKSSNNANRVSTTFTEYFNLTDALEKQNNMHSQ